jgi:hypothetical protein
MVLLDHRDPKDQLEIPEHKDHKDQVEHQLLAHKDHKDLLDLV